MNRFEVILYWSDQDDRFIAEVPELPGCFADGETYAECLQMAETVMQEWIEMTRDMDEPIPTPKGRLMYA